MDEHIFYYKDKTRDELLFDYEVTVTTKRDLPYIPKGMCKPLQGRGTVTFYTEGNENNPAEWLSEDFTYFRDAPDFFEIELKPKFRKCTQCKKRTPKGSDKLCGLCIACNEPIY